MDKIQAVITVLMYLTFYIGEKVLGIYENEYPLGELTAEILDISPDDYQEMRELHYKARADMCIYKYLQRMDMWDKDIDLNTPLTAAQAEMLEALADRPVTPDEDCPELTPAQIAQFKQIAVANREDRCKQTVIMPVSVEKKHFGVTKEGEAVSTYIIKNDVLVVEVMEYGAIIRSLLVQHGGVWTDVVLGYDTLREYEDDDGHLGACVGRVGNRIGGAAFTLNGKTYTLARNDGENYQTAFGFRVYRRTVRKGIRVRCTPVWFTACGVIRL